VAKSRILMDNYFNYIEKWGASPIITFLSFLFGIIGIGLAIYLYFKVKKVKKPCVVAKTINIIKHNLRNIDSFEIFYKGSKIETLSITKLAFWNAGRETINKSDITVPDPLRIEAGEDFKILHADIVKVKNFANQFTINLSQDGSRAFIDFDFIDKYDGAVFQIYHTGESQKDIFIEGTIKGAEKVKYLPFVEINELAELSGEYNLNKTLSKRPYRIIFVFWLIFLFLLAITSVNTIIKIITILIFIMTLILLIYFEIKRRTVPRGLETFFDEF
jgi:hypothetical protein